MSQRVSGYRRKRNDAYYTPPWVTEALLPHIPRRIESVWEPAAGEDAIVRPLRKAGYRVMRSDLSDGTDFLNTPDDFDREAVITNPPYGLAPEFICRALKVTQAQRGFVAMLLATDFDHGKTRRHLFGGCPQFAGKLVLTKRIVWFKKIIAAPSSNHSWFLWDWRRRIAPTIRYYYEEGR